MQYITKIKEAFSFFFRKTEYKYEKNIFGKATLKIKSILPCRQNVQYLMKGESVKKQKQQKKTKNVRVLCE